MDDFLKVRPCCAYCAARYCHCFAMPGRYKITRFHARSRWATPTTKYASADIIPFSFQAKLGIETSAPPRSADSWAQMPGAVHSAARTSLRRTLLHDAADELMDEVRMAGRTWRGAFCAAPGTAGSSTLSPARVSTTRTAGLLLTPAKWTRTAMW